MQTMKLRSIQAPGHAGELLESFIRHEGHLNDDSRELKNERELTPTLERLAQRSLDDGGVWRAWTDEREMWLWASEMSLALSRERGMPVMEIRRYDEHGQMAESGTWVRVRQDQWQRCDG